MEHTWASGAIELIRHADSHIHLETAFDRRIAFISIDNSVETSIRTAPIPRVQLKVKGFGCSRLLAEWRPESPIHLIFRELLLTASERKRSRCSSKRF